MAMIKCPECGKEISDKAAVCPNCGAPVAALTGTLTITREYSKASKGVPVTVQVDENIEEFEINNDESFTAKVVLGKHLLRLYVDGNLIQTFAIDMNEDYYFDFKMQSLEQAYIIESAGASQYKGHEDVGNPNEKKLICPKCHSQNVTVQMVSEQKLVKKKHSILYWVCIGWWWNPFIWFVKWFIFTIPALIFKLFGIGGKKKELVTTHKSMAVCQNCGYHWEV